MKAQMQKGFTLIELMIVVAIIGILAAVAIPQYQTYVAKSQIQRAVAESGAIKTAVEACLLEGKSDIGDAVGECDPQATGSSILDGAAQTSITLPADTGVPQVAIEDDGTATIEAKLGNKAATTLKGDLVEWSRDADGSWVCKTDTDEKFRPAGCTEDI